MRDPSLHAPGYGEALHREFHVRHRLRTLLSKAGIHRDFRSNSIRSKCLFCEMYWKYTISSLKARIYSKLIFPRRTTLSYFNLKSVLCKMEIVVSKDFLPIPYTSFHCTAKARSKIDEPCIIIRLLSKHSSGPSCSGRKLQRRLWRYGGGGPVGVWMIN